MAHPAGLKAVGRVVVETPPTGMVVETPPTGPVVPTARMVEERLVVGVGDQPVQTMAGDQLVEVAVAAPRERGQGRRERGPRQLA
jgi:hypothetical protein